MLDMVHWDEGWKPLVLSTNAVDKGQVDSSREELG